jgi:hypothetical protein
MLEKMKDIVRRNYICVLATVHVRGFEGCLLKNRFSLILLIIQFEIEKFSFPPSIVPIFSQLNFS